jgi:WhiB family transcriptional regulator, redox-sensing transcriptional regulator
MYSMTDRRPRADSDWRDGAACRYVDPEQFSSDIRQSEKRQEHLAQGKAVCRRCDVRIACLSWALSHPEMTDTGVFGGLDERERQELAQTQRAGEGNSGVAA